MSIKILNASTLASRDDRYADYPGRVSPSLIIAELLNVREAARSSRLYLIGQSFEYFEDGSIYLSVFADYRSKRGEKREYSRTGGCGAGID
jgi:hypothetical protein